MKNILFTVLTVLSVSVTFAQKIQFPESFKYDTQIIPEMKLATITDEAKADGIFKSSGLLSTKEEIEAVIRDYDLENVTNVYVEFYEELTREDRNDAGIIVTEFSSKENLEEILPLLYPQSNYVYLTVDKYLIFVWNDGRNSEEKLLKSVKYYQKKLGAKEFIANAESPYSDEVSVEEENPFQEEFSDEATVANSETFTNLGFGSVNAELFSLDEIENLQDYIEKFQQNYNTPIGIESVGTHDLTEDMMEGYAFHLVSLFSDENRIKNNILILYNEVENKSWIYFGTENTKVFNKLPIKKIKDQLNQKLETGEIYKGLNKLLMELEVALINSSGREAKVPSNFNE